jgi:hypothetical protein
MKDYYKSTAQELYGERLKLRNELDRIEHALSFIEVSENNIKQMLWNRYIAHKEETGNILVVKFTGGNSTDPKTREYFEAKQIIDKIYEAEITIDYLFWLNNNRNYLATLFHWL